MSPLGVVLSILIGAVFNGLLIWLVARVSNALEVSGFGPAYIAAIVIAILNGLVNWLFGSTSGGLWGAVINLIVSAILLLIAGRLVKGFKVNGFGGALMAAAAIALFSWLLNWIFIGLKF